MKTYWSVLWKLWQFSAIIIVLVLMRSTPANSADGEAQQRTLDRQILEFRMIVRAGTSQPEPAYWPEPVTAPDSQAFHVRNHGQAQIRMSKPMWQRLWCLKRGCDAGN